MSEPIVVLDDHALFAMGVEMMLGASRPAHTVVARSDGEVAAAEIEAGELPASLYIVDYYIPGSHAPDLVRRIRAAQPDVPVLVFSASHNPSDRAEALRAGAYGFVNKSALPEDILAAIVATLNGELVAPQRPTQVLSHLDLTGRQFEIVMLVSKGLTNKEIAQSLGLSPETVKTHLSHVFRRLGVSGRIEAIDHLRGLGLG